MSKKCYFCDKETYSNRVNCNKCIDCARDYKYLYCSFHRVSNYNYNPRICGYCGDKSVNCGCYKYVKILRSNFWCLIYKEERLKNKKPFYITKCSICPNKAKLKINRTVNVFCSDCTRNKINEYSKNYRKKHYIPHPRMVKTYEPLEWWLRTMGGRTEEDVVADKHGLYIKLYTPKTKDKVEKYYLPDQFQVKKHGLRMSHL